MENIWDVYQYNLVRFNKEQSGRTLTADEFNLVCPVAVMEYLKIKIGLPESYQIGVPIAPQQWQVSQKITDDVKHLLTWMGGPDKPLMKMDSYGVASVPVDYVAFSSCYFEQEFKPNCNTEPVTRPRAIEFVPDGVYADRVSSPVKYPTEKYPIAKWFGDKIQFSPTTMQFVNFTYLRKPVTPFLAVTVDSNSDYVYDANNSVQIEFPQVCLPDIANLIALIMAGQLQSPLYIQLAEMRKEKGA